MVAGALGDSAQSSFVKAGAALLCCGSAEEAEELQTKCMKLDWFDLRSHDAKIDQRSQISLPLVSK